MAILGGVPFILFMSEFVLLMNLFMYNVGLAILFSVLLTLIMFGMGGKMLYMLRGKAEISESCVGKKLGFCAYFPSIVLLLLAIVLTVAGIAVLVKGV